MLQSLVGSSPKQWDTIPPQIEFAYNRMDNRSTRFFHFTLGYTKAPNHIVDLSVGLPDMNPKTEQLTEHITKLHKQVIKNLEAANNSYKAVVDKHHHLKTYEVGGLMMVHLRREHYPMGTYNKIRNKKIKPFCIIHKCEDNAYLLELPPD